MQIVSEDRKGAKRLECGGLDAALVSLEWFDSRRDTKAASRPPHSKRFALIAGLVLLVAASLPAQTPSPTPSCFPTRSVAPDRWRGEYFNNRDLAGSPAMIRDDGDREIDFDWALGSPSSGCGISADEFSVRWTRTLALAGGAYRFTITSDDGVRLLVDGKEKFSNWTDHPLTTGTFEVPIAAGNHKITFEYYERLGSAVARLEWKAHPCVESVPPDRWRAEYFNNESLSGQPAMVRDEGDRALAFEFRDAGPGAACGITQPAYSARWSRKAAFGQGIYRFEAHAEGGLRVFVDGQLRLDQWQRNTAGNANFDLFLEPGHHLIAFEYRRKGARPRGDFSWRQVPCQETTPGDHWRGEYFNNDSLQGSPVMVRDDGERAIGFNWGEASPAAACGVRADLFSVRWRKSHLFAGGVYRFFLSGTGGAKLIVDGETKFDRWQAAAFKQAIEVELAPGPHELALEYADLAGRASVALHWVDPPCIDTTVPPDHWRGEYFDNTALSGRAVVIRDEGTRMLDFEQEITTPQPDCADLTNNFSARWSRIATFEATTYRFTLTADDGARLFIDGKTIIDEWRDQPPASFTADVEMAAGKHRIVQEYYNRFGGATARLLWTPAPCNAAVPIDRWRGEYFNNTDLGGKPVMTRDDDSIALNFDWRLNGPEANCRIDVDNFSIRWTRTATFSAGLYQFHFTGDDGVRVYIDGQLKLDRWQDQMASYSFNAPMTAGVRQITVEYFEHWGSAAIQFDWERHPCFADVPPEHWRGEYFNNTTLTGPPAMIRDDGDGGLNFDWEAQSPMASCGVNADDFSVRWSRKVVLAAGRHRFTVMADDGVRLFVNGRRVIDEWRNQKPETFTADVMLPAGSNRIVVEYYDHTGGAVAKVNWEMAKETTPRLVN